MSMILNWLVALAPLAGAVFVLVRRHEPTVAAVDRADAWVALHLHHSLDAEEFLGRYVARPVLAPFKAIGDLTADIDDPFLKSALRLLAAGYLVVCVLWVASLLPYVLTALLAVVLFLAAVQNLMNGSGSSKPVYRATEPADSAQPAEHTPSAEGRGARPAGDPRR
jgi:hypothetical protein